MAMSAPSAFFPSESSAGSVAKYIENEGISRNVQKSSGHAVMLEDGEYLQMVRQRPSR
jgi:hypothetical protein